MLRFIQVCVRIRTFITQQTLIFIDFFLSEGLGKCTSIYHCSYSKIIYDLSSIVYNILNIMSRGIYLVHLNVHW